jgi:hypothetical protein
MHQLTNSVATTINSTVPHRNALLSPYLKAPMNGLVLVPPRKIERTPRSNEQLRNAFRR